MPELPPPRRFLFGPGPSQLETRVYAAMAKPLVGNVDPYLFEAFDEIRDGLRAAFGTKNPYTLTIPGTGSAGMETAVSNFVDPGTKLAIFVNGFFGERIAEMGLRHGAQVVRAHKPWGEVFTEAEARAFLEKERPHTVAFVHGETSTGAMQAPEAITGPAHEVGALVIADCVTALGSVPIRVDETGIDIAYSCTQKGLSAPPGMSPFTVSPRAVERLQARTTPNSVWYLDLKLLMEYYDGKKYHHTAPTPAIYALREALAAIREEGLEARFARHLKMHALFVQRIEAMGLKMHVSPGHRLTTINTPRVPDGVDDARVRKQLVDEYGIEIAGGFGVLAGKIFRIGVMGPLATETHLDLFFEGFGKCLGSRGTS